MTIDGIYYTEPELAAKFRQMQETIERLDGENYNLTEKLEEIGTAFNEQVSLVGWHEEQEKEYKRLLKAAVADFKEIIPDMLTCKYCKWYNEEADECTYCPDDVPCKKICGWKHEGEVLKLIGEEP